MSTAKKILIADDEPDILEILQFNLQQEGYEVVTAKTGDEAIEKAKQNPIHRLIHGLCIHHVGKKVSKLLAEQLDYVPNLVHWKLE